MNDRFKYMKFSSSLVDVKNQAFWSVAWLVSAMLVIILGPFSWLLVSIGFIVGFWTASFIVNWAKLEDRPHRDYYDGG